MLPRLGDEAKGGRRARWPSIFVDGALGLSRARCWDNEDMLGDALAGSMEVELMLAFINANEGF